MHERRGETRLALGGTSPTVFAQAGVFTLVKEDRECQG